MSHKNINSDVNTFSTNNDILQIEENSYYTTPMKSIGS